MSEYNNSTEYQLIGAIFRYPGAAPKVCRQVRPVRRPDFSDPVAGCVFGCISDLVTKRVNPTCAEVERELHEWADDPLQPDEQLNRQAIASLPAMEASCPDDVTEDNAAQFAINLANAVIEHQAAQGPQIAEDEDSTENDLPLHSMWPAPPDAAAYHGLAGDIVRAIEPHTEADPVALLIQILTMFGNAIGRDAYFCVEAHRHYMNLYCALIGISSKGRKGTSYGHAHNLFQTVAPDWANNDHIVSGVSSGEGIIWNVRDPITRQQPIKENRRVVDYEDVIEDAGVKDKRLLIVEAEFASVLKAASREGNTLSPVIRKAWDDGELRTLNKNSPAKATGAHISIIGHVTKDELVRYLNSTEAANGFANRFLWLCVRRSKLLPEGGRINEVDFASLLKRLTTAVDFAHNARELRRDEAARVKWHEVYPKLSAGNPGLLGAVTGRAESQVMRLACVYALLDCSDVIRHEHLIAALALWKYAEDSARFVFGDSLGDHVADTILEALRHKAPDGLKTSEINGLFSNNADSRRVKAALSTLLEANLIRRHKAQPEPGKQSQGRPAEVWYAVFQDCKLSDYNDRNDKNDRNPKEAAQVGDSDVSIVSIVDTEKKQQDVFEADDSIFDDEEPGAEYGTEQG